MEDSNFIKDFLTWVLVIGGIVFGIYKERQKQKQNPTTVQKDKASSVANHADERVHVLDVDLPNETTPQPLHETTRDELLRKEGIPTTQARSQVLNLTPITVTPKFSPHQRKLRHAIIWGEILRPKF